jgi:GTP-binding protein of the ras superfamily involved in termination of M-phase
MVRYVEKRFDQDYVETLGVNFMEKTITLPQAEARIYQLLNVSLNAITACAGYNVHLGSRRYVPFDYYLHHLHAVHVAYAGDRSYVSMMPMVCVDAVAVLFMFDLTQRSTLTSVREWYRQVRGLNKVPYVVLCPHTLSVSFYLHFIADRTGFSGRHEV